jgi:hypothetical protein
MRMMILFGANNTLYMELEKDREKVCLVGVANLEEEEHPHFSA